MRQGLLYLMHTCIHGTGAISCHAAIRLWTDAVRAQAPPLGTSTPASFKGTAQQHAQRSHAARAEAHVCCSTGTTSWTHTRSTRAACCPCGSSTPTRPAGSRCGHPCRAPPHAQHHCRTRARHDPAAGAALGDAVGRRYHGGAQPGMPALSVSCQVSLCVPAGHRAGMELRVRGPVRGSLWQLRLPAAGHRPGGLLLPEEPGQPRVPDGHALRCARLLPPAPRCMCPACSCAHDSKAGRPSPAQPCPARPHAAAWLPDVLGSATAHRAPALHG